MKLNKWLIWCIVLLVIIFSRFYNLERNLKFNRDESSDLVRIHQYWVDKKVSLIGPISEDGNLVYSSLSYYLEMPAAVLLNFKAVSPTVGNAFWSVVTVVLMFVWLKVRNKNISFLDIALLVCWYPLVITSRWAWNPNLIPLFMIVGVILVESKKWWVKFLGGLAFGFSGHLHYLALFPTFILSLIRKKPWMAMIGFCIPIVIFILFDVTHPPGLFITRAFLFKQGQTGFNIGAFNVGIRYLMGSGLWFVLGLVTTSILMYFDYRNRNIDWRNLIAVVLAILIVSFLKNPEEHYFIGAIIPFWLWVSKRRENMGLYLKNLLIIILILGSVKNSYNLIFGKMPDDSAYSADKISEVISSDITKNGLINANIAVLGSTDINSFGVKYRDLLLTSNTKIRSKEEYDVSDNLYVITQESDETILRSDPSVQMQLFENRPIKFDNPIQGTNWRVVRFDKY